MKLKEIRQMAKEHGIKSTQKNEIEMIREIQRAEGNFACCGTAKGFCDQSNCIFRANCLNTAENVSGA